MKSNKLRKFIKTIVDTVGVCYYHDAPDKSTISTPLFPHIVFDFKSVDLGDYYRQDYELVFDVWCKNNQQQAEDIADSLCELLQCENLPQAEFLPTFYRESRRNLLDEDKDINHIQIEYVVQVYDREE